MLIPKSTALPVTEAGSRIIDKTIAGTTKLKREMNLHSLALWLCLKIDARTRSRFRGAMAVRGIGAAMVHARKGVGEDENEVVPV